MHPHNNSQPYQDWYPDGGDGPTRINPSSIGLLIVFLAAFLFLAYMAMERPWAGAADTPTPGAQTSVEPGVAPNGSGEQAPVAAEAQQ